MGIPDFFRVPFVPGGDFFLLADVTDKKTVKAIKMTNIEKKRRGIFSMTRKQKTKIG